MHITTASITLLAHAGHAHELGGPNLGHLLLAALPFLAGGALLARGRDAAIATVVLFSAAAGFVHAVVTPEHFREHLAFGLFSLAVTVWQLAVVVAGLNRPSRALWVWTAAGNLAVLTIWALSRTTGLPVGPEPWTPEPAGLLDLACGAYEVAVIAGCLSLATVRGLMTRYSGPNAPISRRGALVNL
jgi:hypothetical protein